MSSPPTTPHRHAPPSPDPLTVSRPLPIPSVFALPSHSSSGDGGGRRDRAVRGRRDPRQLVQGTTDPRPLVRRIDPGPLVLWRSRRGRLWWARAECAGGSRSPSSRRSPSSPPAAALLLPPAAPFPQYLTIRGLGWEAPCKTELFMMWEQNG